jgi:hypothetical protein
MMTLQEWYSDEARSAILNDVLRDPILLRAFEVVEGANTPAFRPGVSTTDLAMVHSFQAGVHHVRRALTALTRKPEAMAEELPEWEGEHILTQPTTESNERTS